MTISDRDMKIRINRLAKGLGLRLEKNPEAATDFDNPYRLVNEDDELFHKGRLSGIERVLRDYANNL
ncbi:MAG: hypothetical protein AAGK23_03085 [Pseudomonadota bacterium]